MQEINQRAMDTSTIRSELKARVAKGLNFGIEGVEDVLAPASPTYNDFILLKSKYNDLMYVSSINTLPYEQVELGLDRLRKSLLDMIDSLDEQSLKKEQVEQGLKVQALPARRANFFKLLDIHYQNLQAITYTITYGADMPSQTNTGRQAIFELYQSIRRNKRHEEDNEKLMEFFKDYFTNEIGILEVYFKNIKHLLAYTLESDIEKDFFLDTLKSLFSRFELVMILYFALSRLDMEFTGLVIETQLVDASVDEIALKEKHRLQLYG